MSGVGDIFNVHALPGTSEASEPARLETIGGESSSFCVKLQLTVWIWVFGNVFGTKKDLASPHGSAR